jgi:hypothetical protein
MTNPKNAQLAFAWLWGKETGCSASSDGELHAEQKNSLSALLPATFAGN